MGTNAKNRTLPILREIFPSSAHALIRKGRRSRRRPHNTIEVESETRVKKLIAHVSAIFLLPVIEKRGILSGFSAIVNGIGTIQGGNINLCDGKSRRRSVDGSVTCWFPVKRPLA